MSDLSENGSCWDEAPFGPGQSNGLLCELRSGYAGAHQAGDAEWMVVSGKETQGEPRDAPTAQLSARKGGKSRALIDQLLSQANEHGIHVEVTYPQSEPSDAQVLAALNAYYADYMIRPNKSLDDVRPPRTVQDMRAALRAAGGVK